MSISSKSNQWPVEERSEFLYTMAMLRLKEWSWASYHRSIEFEDRTSPKYEYTTPEPLYAISLSRTGFSIEGHTLITLFTIDSSKWLAPFEERISIEYSAGVYSTNSTDGIMASLGPKCYQKNKKYSAQDILKSDTLTKN